MAKTIVFIVGRKRYELVTLHEPGEGFVDVKQILEIVKWDNINTTEQDASFILAYGDKLPVELNGLSLLFMTKDEQYGLTIRVVYRKPNGKWTVTVKTGWHAEHCVADRSCRLVRRLGELVIQ